MPIELTPISYPDSASWYYADQQAVEDLLGAANLRISSDLEDAEQGDDDLADDQIALIQRDGETADAWFNVMLRGGSYAVPIVVGGIAVDDLDPSHETRRFFRYLSSLYVAYLLVEHRMVQSIGGMTAQDLTKLAASWLKRVTDALQKVADGDYVLIADASTPDVETHRDAPVAGRIPIPREFLCGFGPYTALGPLGVYGQLLPPLCGPICG